MSSVVDMSSDVMIRQTVDKMYLERNAQEDLQIKLQEEFAEQKRELNKRSKTVKYEWLQIQS